MKIWAVAEAGPYEDGTFTVYVNSGVVPCARVRGANV
jgi:hypothetical protein